jgi:RNA polymerase sigma-70 factor, ECF subfamily
MDIQAAITKAKEGDREAFGHVFDQFSDRIFRYIRFKVKDQVQAEDILQEVFLKAWLGLPKLSAESLNFSAWIYRIASNTVNDFYRKQYRTPIMVDLESVPEIESNDHQVDIFDIQFLNQGMEKLPVQYKEILELRFVQEFNLEETSKILNKTNMAVRIAQHRALKSLRKILEGMEKDNVK